MEAPESKARLADLMDSFFEVSLETNEAERKYKSSNVSKSAIQIIPSNTLNNSPVCTFSFDRIFGPRVKREVQPESKFTS